MDIYRNLTEGNMQWNYCIFWRMLEGTTRKNKKLQNAGASVASESALRSAGILLSRVRAPPPTPLPDGGPESLRSPYCGLAVYKKTETSLIMLK
ncbi:hypothetical protein PoB_007460300 [Plakobranchus ocellatus]|uniref:Uncharacterized protein n=1 Tax=Plakobranchus ocellatus TaxID=259542 RepID=A0AAV4DVI0_9GAST|nr:hypothetical protein PoB_007460300 [Plakobranchus ocellatus]